MNTLKTTIASCFVMMLVIFGKSQNDETIMMEEMEVIGQTVLEKPFPIGSSTRLLDVIHMDLAISFDWPKKQANGKAILTCTPYSRSIDSALLDAQGFDIHRVAIKKNTQWEEAPFSYDGWDIQIAMDSTKTRRDTFDILIEYTAKPYDLNVKGGNAISDAKGLYFINPENDPEGYMPQIWTQGETEFNSAWFPTIDKPNEKITHEIAITVDSTLRTVSNGRIDFITQNGDGTRTDYWTMEKPHAPYLVMMAIGDFKEVKDEWNGMPVNYYVEEEWVSTAQRTFGNTPEMISFFSEILDYPYPWNKYDQVVVREYVSGAMENTTGVIHGDFIYTDEKSFNDDPHEDVIAHELFHHWFGDLVTCENWGNLPLNESFATYGEYFWKEYKYGKEEADWHLLNDLNSYLNEFHSGHQVNMIRYDVEQPLEMFDSHSYAKGGRILHMLRNYLGDESFFRGLNIYLKENEYSSAEIHNLRMAFEKASGEDLNWFFNQWFMAKGHPVLDISYDYDKENGVQNVTVKQTQDLQRFPLYILPVSIDVHFENDVIHRDVIINKEIETFSFKTDEKPKWVSFDADKMLLCEKTDQRGDAFNLGQLKSSLMLDRRESVKSLSQSINKNLRSTVSAIAMKDNFWAIRIQGLDMIAGLDQAGRNKVLRDVLRLAEKDDNYKVKARAISALSDYYDQNESAIFNNGWAAKSYNVNKAALYAKTKYEREEGLTIARDLVQKEDEYLFDAGLKTLSKYGSSEDLEVLNEAISKVEPSYYRYFYLQYVSDYALYHMDGSEQEAIDILKDLYRNDNTYWMKSRCKSLLMQISDGWRLKAEVSTEEVSKELTKKANALDEEIKALEP